MSVDNFSSLATVFLTDFYFLVFAKIRAILVVSKVVHGHRGKLRRRPGGHCCGGVLFVCAGSLQDGREAQRRCCCRCNGIMFPFL